MGSRGIHVGMSLLLARQQERACAWLYRRLLLSGRRGSSLTCDQAERAVSCRLDGELPPSEDELLAGHLRSCAHCVRFERLHLHCRVVLRAFAFAPVPDSLLTGASRRPPGR